MTCMSAPAFYLGQIAYGDFFLGFFLYLGINPFLPPPLRLWTCQLTWSITLLTCIQTCNITIVIYGYARSFTNHITWHKNMNSTSKVIYHYGYILIALWRNRNAREIRFTVEHQFCQKLCTDHQWSLFPGKYYQILLDLLTIRLWRDHSSDRNVLGTLVTVYIYIFFSVFIGTSSSGFIYLYKITLFSQNLGKEIND